MMDSDSEAFQRSLRRDAREMEAGCDRRSCY